jgi:hypothetical protein
VQGWDVVALSDQFPGFAGSCGRCYEIRCNPATVKDGYGASFDRTHACIDPSTSLLVRVADACPCSYPNNWCGNGLACLLRQQLAAALSPLLLRLVTADFAGQPVASRFSSCLPGDCASRYH